MCEVDRVIFCIFSHFFFFQAEDGIRDLVRSRGLGDVYKRQIEHDPTPEDLLAAELSAGLSER